MRALSLCASANFTIDLRRPAVNIGWVTSGTKLHALLGPLNRSIVASSDRRETRSGSALGNRRLGQRQFQHSPRRGSAQQPEYRAVAPAKPMASRLALQAAMLSSSTSELFAEACFNVPTFGVLY